MNNIVNYDQAIEYNNRFWIGVELYKMEAFVWILDNTNDPLVQSIATFEGKRVTDVYDDNGYCELCSQLWDKIATKTNRPHDFGSSYTLHSIYGFLSEIIVKIYAHNKELRIKMLEDKVTKAQQKLVQAKKEYEDATS